MLPYWLLFTIYTAGTLQYRRRDPSQTQALPLLIAAGCLTALMVGLRYEVGGDWFNYVEMFDMARHLRFSKVLELGDPGYQSLNWLALELGLDIWAVNLVCGAIFTWGLIKFAKNQPNPWLVMLVALPYLIIVVVMGYTRQAVAIGFILAGLAQTEKRLLTRMGFYILLAALFHKTAVVLLPIVAMAGQRQRLLTVTGCIVLSVTFYSFFLSSMLDSMVTNYVQAGMESEGAAIRVVMNLVPAVLFLLFQKHFGLPKQTLLLWRNLSLAAVGMLGLLALLPSSTAVDRLALYLIPLQLFVLARLPHAFLDNGRPNVQLTIAVIIYSAAIQFTWLNYAQNAEYWLPYEIYPLTGA